MIPDLGIIEGYYGKPWSDERREHAIAFLKPHGYGFFLFAPKADEFLRKRWREPYPKEEEAQLRRMAAHCKTMGVRFGVGLSPYELYRDFSDDAKTALAEKLALFNSIGVEMLAILFDDMRGDIPDLARTQTDILHWIASRAKAPRLLMCPSYYTDDPVLDRIFGHRPANYLEDLGRSQFLHLRGFTGRPAAIGEKLSGHAINPALQPTLSLIPALTLAESYERGETYEYGAAFLRAAKTVLGGDDLAQLVQADIIALNDAGLDRLGNRAARLRERYAKFDHPGAEEIVGWLDGEYRFATEIA